jgi:prepilin-type N-terminal cleavage/methylation domain-containing protein
MRNRAFTLIELMVVLVVVATLAGILLPALATARRRAHGNTCISNLRQLGMVTMAYLDDHDLEVPWYVSIIDAYYMQPGGYMALATAAHKVLLPGLRDKRLLRCPLDIGAQFYPGEMEQALTPVWERFGTSYLSGLDNYRLGSLPRYEVILWMDHVGFWHIPHRGVLDYTKGWADNRSKWRHNAVTSHLRTVTIPYNQAQGALWGYNVLEGRR